MVGEGASLFQRGPRTWLLSCLQSQKQSECSVNRFFFPAVQDLKEEIDIRLSRVQDIKYEPWLLAEDDSRLLQLETQGTLSCCMSVGGHRNHRPVLVLLQQVVPLRPSCVSGLSCWLSHCNVVFGEPT